MNRKKFIHSALTLGSGILFSKKSFGQIENIHNSQSETRMPQPLNAGSVIGITCISDSADSNELSYGVALLQSMGYKIKLSNCTVKNWQRYAGTDEARAKALQDMLDDDEINAIMFGCGGYGAIRMMDKINWEKFCQNPKWLIGFSDLTALHCHIHTNFGIPTIHGPMCCSLNSATQQTKQKLKSILNGETINYIVGGYAMNREGTASGKLIGGNLTMIASMQGSKSALNTAGKILLIEDTGEYKYSIDRLMMNLKRSGMFDNLAGIIFGSFTATRTSNEVHYAASVEEILMEKVAEYNYPVCFHFPAGHQKQNLPLKLGVTYNIEINKNQVNLHESASNQF